MENKVQFNLKNVHYATMKDEGGYNTPKPVPGAVSLTLTPSGDTSTFYADGLAYYVSATNNGYTGSIEMARFTDEMMQDVYKWLMDESKVLTESALVEVAPIALLFEIDGDKDQSLFVLYNVTLGRPTVNGSTNTQTKDVKTQTADVTAAPLADGKVFARTTHQTASAIKADWFKHVYTGVVAGDAAAMSLSNEQVEVQADDQ